MSIFKQRRETFLNTMSEGVAIIPSNQELIRNSDVHFTFRQESNFFYYTGFDEPNSVLVLVKKGNTKKSILFLRPKDPLMELWCGIRLGVEAAPKQLVVEESYLIDEFQTRLATLLENTRRLYVDFTTDLEFTKNVLVAVDKAQKKKRVSFGPTEIVHISTISGKMRLYKDAYDIEKMKMAAAINNKAYRAAMAFAKPGKNEKDIQALMEFVYGLEHAKGVAYGSIVAGGNNANILHYVENNKPLKDGELLLIDSGPEVEYYASDVTRTFPISGKFTSAQKDVYNVVLKVQKDCINKAKAGASYDSLSKHAIKELSQGMIDLKLIKKSIDEILEKELYREFYPHNLGHWLGMDVHDVGPYKEDNGVDSKVLEIGMYLTIEPGLYLNANNPNVPEHLKGIGIRIEDDILITKDGNLNLTASIPKEISDVEAACQANYKDYLSLN